MTEKTVVLVRCEDMFIADSVISLLKKRRISAIAKKGKWRGCQIFFIFIAEELADKALRIILLHKQNEVWYID